MNPPDKNLRPELDHAWERRLDAELRALPELDAPAALLTDVMAIVRAREAMRARVWWRRPVTTWHPAMRMSFAVAAAAVLGALIIGGHLLWPELQTSSVMNSLSALGAKFSALWSAGRTVVEAISLAVHSIFTPLRLAILGAIILSQVALFGAGSAAMRTLLQPSRTA